MGNVVEAMKFLEQAEHIVNEVVRKLKEHPDLLYSGFLTNALSEFAEAKILFSLIQNNDVPTFEELGIPPVPYLQGLGDVVGELRRRAIECLGMWRIDEAEKILKIMESIFRNLSSLDYPEALIPGIRHKADVARRLVEDLRTMITEIKTRKVLIDRIDSLKSLLTSRNR